MRARGLLEKGRDLLAQRDVVRAGGIQERLPLFRRAREDLLDQPIDPRPLTQMSVTS